MLHKLQVQLVQTRAPRMTQIALAASIVLSGLATQAQALEIDTGNEDLAVRWDNQVRYNLGTRVESVNPDFANNPGSDATELSVKRGGVIMNRLDLLSELDVVYKGRFGARVSAAAWSDFAASNNVRSNPALSAFPSEYTGGEYNSYAKRFNKGPSGEILDAFVFGSFDLGSVPVNVKLGKHVTYWGEGLFNLFHSVSYSQAPLDLLKATTSPGIDAKEVFRPINQLSAQAQLTDRVSVGAQVMLDWEPARLPAGGTYFGGADASRADRVSAGPGFAFPVTPDIEPTKKRGQFGLNLRWSPEALQQQGGAVGFYYRKFNEVMPWGLLRMSPFTGSPANPTVPQALRLAFAQDTELFATSFTGNINGVNVGTELSYRKNTALISGSTPVDARVVGFQGTEGARGNTFHLLLNSIFVLPETPLFKGGSLTGEFVYSRLDKVTRNEGLFLGAGTPQCAAVARGAAVAAGIKEVNRGCATKDYYGIQVNATLDYPQALPGVNLSVPISVSYGLKGNAAIPGGGNEGAVTWSVGVDANYRNAHRFSLKYNDSKARYANVGGQNIANGSAINNNHGWLSFTYKTSF